MASSSSNVSVSPSAVMENGSEPGVKNRCKHEHRKDQAAAPRLQPCVGQNTDEVEHHHQQREFEAHPEHQQQVDQETEIAVAGQRRHLHVAAHGQQELQSLGHHHVRQHRTGDEEQCRRHHERDREPFSFWYKPGVMNAQSW